MEFGGNCMANQIKKETIHAQGISIQVYTEDFKNDFISLTDIAQKRENEYPGFVIQNWMRNKNTIEFLGLWESIHNPDFNYLEFEVIKKEAGFNGFVMTPKRWIETTNAIGIVSKQGRYANTFAHKNIAFEFASWISPAFKLYVIEDYQRLKDSENNKLSLAWNLNREIAKLNYRIHTDAIKENLIPAELTAAQKSFVYADEADMLNVALFGMTAKEWKDKNKTAKGNIRDNATINQLLVLANMENYNAIMIKQDIPQSERIVKLRELAVQQLSTLQSLDISNITALDKR